MQDLMKLMPHSKKDAKVDLKEGVGAVNEIAEMEVGRLAGCAELRARTATCPCCSRSGGRRMSKAPSGPSVKFQCANGKPWLARGRTGGSAHDGRAQAHRQLPQGASANSRGPSSSAGLEAAALV